MTSIAPRLSVSQLLLKLVELTAWFGKISGFNAAEQIKSNFYKLIDFAREFESKGLKNLQDFIIEPIRSILIPAYDKRT